jgi:MFS family permease
MFKQISADCSKEAFDKDTIVECETFVYDNSYFDETLATKFNLVCNDEYKANLLGSVLMVGLLAGSIVGGRLGDLFGRKLTMSIAAGLIIPVTLGAGYVPSYGGKLEISNFFRSKC